MTWHPTQSRDSQAQGASREKTTHSSLKCPVRYFLTWNISKIFAGLWACHHRAQTRNANFVYRKELTITRILFCFYCFEVPCGVCLHLYIHPRIKKSSEYSTLVRDSSLWGCWQSVRSVRSPTFTEPPPGPRPSHMPSISDDPGEGWGCVSGEIFDVILGDVDVIKMTLMLWCHITLETEILTTLPCHVRAKNL